MGVVVPGDELAAASGIGEWARRVRGLRVEDGWPIESGHQRADIGVDEYVLVANQPDEAIAASWRLAARIRAQPGAGKGRLLAL